MARPKGTAVRLLDDPGRFEVAAWHALTTGLHFNPYTAAYMVTFLVASDRPITTESLDGVLLKSTTEHRVTAVGHADRIRRKAPEAIARANDRELAWLTSSAALLVAIVKFAADSNSVGIMTTLDLLKEAGWSGVLLRIAGRLHNTLRSNFPTAEGPLNRAAARLLRTMHG
jgi:hypothetical protein